MAEILYVNAAPAGTTQLTTWAAEHRMRSAAATPARWRGAPVAEDAVRIEASDQRTTIEIARNAKDLYNTCRIRVQAQTGAGEFAGENAAVHLSAFERFLGRFEVFLATRQGSARLEATEDCHIEFFRWNAKGDVGVRFRISKYVYGRDPVRAVPVSVAGEFTLDGGSLDHVGSDFRDLAASLSLASLAPA
jgi:hypothetical protein